MVSFDDTKVAFASKSDKELQWAYRLFKMISKPWLVKLGNIGQNVAFAIHLPIKGLIKKTIFRQFCGGETIDDCDNQIAALNKYNIGTILDYSVEGMEAEKDLDATKDEIIATIKKAKDNDAIPFAVFKVTGICRTKLLEKANPGEDKLNDAEKAEWDRVKGRVEEICKTGHELDVPVFIDAEDSWFQDGIDRLADEMMAKYNKQKAIIYNTLQMYRHDRLEFLKKSHQTAVEKDFVLGIKLVRGAYMEKEGQRAMDKGYPTPIQKDKATTDLDFNAALKFMCENLDRVWFCAGTHNEYSSKYLTDLMSEMGIDKSDKRIYFAQLLGMSDHISYNLAHSGYNVAKYVPYGPVKKVMPYLVRRAQENTSVAGQTGRELALIIRERNRRKGKEEYQPVG
ncbi:proline dehydrogenase family protein [Paracrocinitomix mangrovi]|uniref:proline dehydrogenase family protein n=1 Tax=Paracrocinitomix mangrovi TaxID=2862509 RepID=UPI001C8EF7E2|nr:proline dehydrogenase family protein [Paracrocinitomix mangrovi]UKN01424.1 proline dehydrogenase family protein [Paracrocinitomix mangrovi]